MKELQDLTVLELASVLAGPSVGQFFAELGARVIKVENARTSGDVTRSWKTRGEQTDDRSAYFCAVNWGKQSIAVDLTTVEGRDIVHRLAARSDIVIASYKPRDAEKLGVDYQTLSEVQPSIIYGQITGYGSDDLRVGYDAVIQAESGFMYLNGEPGGPSLKMPVALIDILAGHQLKEGILLALLERNRTGLGKLIEVSLIDTAVASLANQASNYLVGGQQPGKKGSAHPNIAPYGDIFSTADGRELLLAVGSDRQFQDLCYVLAISELANDDRFRDNPHRVQNRPVLNRALGDAMRTMPAARLLSELRSRNVPAALIRGVGEVLDDPRTRDIMLSSGLLRGVRTYVARTGADPDSHILPPPHLGEHTSSLLREMLNFSPTAVKNLLEKGAIR